MGGGGKAQVLIEGLWKARDSAFLTGTQLLLMTCWRGGPLLGAESGQPASPRRGNPGKGQSPWSRQDPVLNVGPGSPVSWRRQPGSAELCDSQGRWDPPLRARGPDSLLPGGPPTPPACFLAQDTGPLSVYV